MVQYSCEYCCHFDDYALVIYTNEITNEILQSVEITAHKVLFSMPFGKKPMNMVIDFKADFDVWVTFLRQMDGVGFAGSITNKHLTVAHFENMPRLKYLYIGHTDYSLFDGEDISALPTLKILTLNGFGVVEQSNQMKQWMKQLTDAKCQICQLV